jgi:hypothetical protein
VIGEVGLSWLIVRIIETGGSIRQAPLAARWLTQANRSGHIELTLKSLCSDGEGWECVLPSYRSTDADLQPKSFT